MDFKLEKPDTKPDLVIRMSWMDAQHIRSDIEGKCYSHHATSQLVQYLMNMEKRLES